MNETRGLWRGKRIDNGEWVKDDLVCDKYFDGSMGYFIFERDFDNSKSYKIDPSTLGECTGLRDKNGKLIFEGDVLRYGEYALYTVFWNEELARFSLRYINTLVWYEFDTIDSTSYEIVGNIYDNPELLKEERGAK